MTKIKELHLTLNGETINKSSLYFGFENVEVAKFSHGNIDITTFPDGYLKEIVLYNVEGNGVTNMCGKTDTGVVKRLFDHPDIVHVAFCGDWQNQSIGADWAFDEEEDRYISEYNNPYQKTFSKDGKIHIKWCRNNRAIKSFLYKNEERRFGRPMNEDKQKELLESILGENK